MNLYDYIQRHQQWSHDTFGPVSHRGPEGSIKHLRKEVEELAADPTDVSEVADVMILAIDIAYRAGITPEELITGLQDKQDTNIARKWPHWRKADPNEPVEHER